MNKHKIIIAGGSGFLGRNLERYFIKKGYEVRVLTRTKRADNDVLWDAKNVADWKGELEGAYALINMAGRSVNCRYTEYNKAIILSSRIDSTRVLGEAIQQCKKPPKHWLNSSTATIYEHSQGKAPANTETKGVIGSGFSEEVAKQWEAEFFKAKLPKTRRTALRTSIVLGEDGGALPTMANLARMGFCSPQGSGQQWISWIHVKDFLRAVRFILDKKLEGPVNICSPNYIRNEDFNALLQDIFEPTFIFPQPLFLLNLGAKIMGTETELILKSRKVYPGILMEKGFEFRFAKCKDALEDLLAEED